MSKYTAEQVQKIRAAHYEYMREYNAKPDAAVLSVLDDFAALLRERESAKAAVTNEMVEIAVNAHADWFGGHRGMRAALEAVAPMLASARVLELENALRMVVAANAMLSEIEGGKTLYEGSPTHSTPCLLAWSNLNTAIANAKQVLAAALKPEKE